MSEDKNMAGNLLDATRAKLGKGVDRTEAVGHDIASMVGNDPPENAADKANAAAARLETKGHNAQADHHLSELKKNRLQPLSTVKRPSGVFFYGLVAFLSLTRAASGPPFARGPVSNRTLSLTERSTCAGKHYSR